MTFTVELEQGSDGLGWVTMTSKGSSHEMGIKLHAGGRICAKQLAFLVSSGSQVGHRDNCP